MRKPSMRPALPMTALLPAILALGLLAPGVAAAQPPSRADLVPAVPSTTIPGLAGMDIHPGQWLAVGAGVIAGVLAVEVLIPTHLIYVAGGAAGGYLADAWYGGRHVEVRTRP